MRSPVTKFILIVNVAVHMSVILFLSGMDPRGQQIFYEWFVKSFGLLPQAFWEGAVWQPLTSLFVHGIFIHPEGMVFHPANFLHIGVNMLAVWSLGMPIEHTIGSVRFAWLYFISGFVGALAVLFGPLIAGQGMLDMPTVGASGSVLGLLAALAVFFPRSQLLVFFLPMKARTAAIIFGSASLIFAIMDEGSGISHWGHLGGLIGGVLYSRFALRLDFGKSNLSSGFSQRGPATATRPGGSYNTDPREEEILRMMEEMMRRRAGQGPMEPGVEPRSYRLPSQGPNVHRDNAESSGEFPGEKEINPPPGRQSDSGSSGSDSQKKLYFDPATGKFFFK